MFARKRVQRNAAPMILFDAGQFSAAQTAGATDLDSFRAEILRGLQRLLHGAAERNAAFQLQRDIFRHELRIDFRLS